MNLGSIIGLERACQPRMPWGAPQDRMRERSELEAAVGHLCLPTDGSMELDCWIHGSMDLHW
eukprot:scaffold15256_cov65-Phaeocystis_antarctica.AAC.1